MEEFRPVTKEDIPEVTRYYMEYLNSGDIIGDSIRRAYDKGDYYGYKALIDGHTAGYFTFQKNVVFTYPHPGEYDEVIAAAGRRSMDTVDALMVLPGYRRQGLAGRLAKKSREELKDRGINLFMAEIWMYPDGSTPARKIYEKMGKPIFSKAVSDFYRDAHEYGIICPLCGEKCICGALIEIIDVSR